MSKFLNQTRSEGIDGDVWERVLADVRGHLFAAKDLQAVAVKANLSYSTVAKLAYGDTKSPHMRTVIKIMDALGKADPILQAFRSEKPVTVVQADQRRPKRTVRDRIKKERTDRIFPHRNAKERGSPLH